MADGVFLHVLNLNNDNAPNVNILTRERLTHIVNESSLFAVVLDVDAVVAFIICHAHGADYDSPNYQYFDARFKHHDFLYVDRIIVKDSHRGRGLGKLLYSFVDRAVEPSLFKHLCCEVNIKPANPESLAFHERCGFTCVGEQDTEEGKKRVALLCRPMTA